MFVQNIFQASERIKIGNYLKHGIFEVQQNYILHQREFIHTRRFSENKLR